MSRPFRPSRRNVLRGAASSLALPFLPSLLPRSARAQDAGTPRRMLVYFCPNGLLHDISVPNEVGPISQLPAGIAGLAPVLARSTVLTNLDNKSVGPSSGDTHDTSVSTLLTDVPTINGKPGTSFDQLVATTLAGDTPFASMQLGIETSGTRLGGSISYASGAQPLVPTVAPRAAFDLLFKGEDLDVSIRDAIARKEMRYSILDRVMDRTSSMQQRLSSEDSDRLDQYLTGIRDLENRLVQLESVECPEPAAPRNGLPLPEHHQVMRDLMVIAFQCDYTRIMSFMAGDSASYLVYDHLNFQSRSNQTAHHDVGHHGNLNDYQADLATLQSWIVGEYANLALELEALPDGEGGNLLDHTAMLFVTDWGDANVHEVDNMTFLLTGGEAAGWVHGQHRPQGGAAHSHVFLNMLDFMGLPADRFGDHARTPIDLS